MTSAGERGESPPSLGNGEKQTPVTTESADLAKMPTHVLLTVLGLNPRHVCYVLGERRVEAGLAPLALIDLLPEGERPQLVIALCTPEAKVKSLPSLEAALQGRCKVQPIDVPAGDTQDDVKRYLSIAAGAIPADCGIELTVDVTHGYRHFSYLTYLAVLYLVGLRGIRLRGAYYGLLRCGAPSPFLDLGPLLALPRWFHVLEVLRETGSAIPLATTLADGNQGQLAQTISRDLSQISESYLSGLPLELGHHARQFCNQRMKPLRRLLDAKHHLPLATEMVDRLKETLEPFALTGDSSGDAWKRQVAIAEPELRREGRVVDDLFHRGSVATALGLLNEWTVSWVAWRCGHESAWLDFQKVRRSAGSLLGAMAAVGRDPDLSHLLSEEQRKLGNFWYDLCALRNAYHHHGMRPQVLVANTQASEKLARVRCYWEEVLRACPAISLKFGESCGGRTLVSPIGKRPGVLFSALRACQINGMGLPARCLVICSRDTEGLIAEASRKAGFEGDPVPLHLTDPFGGRREIERVAREARPHLLGADEVLVNVTGGTTLMGLVADALAGAARRLARPVRRFGLIDRRAPADQGADPFQVGEPFWLDSSEGGDGHAD